MPRRISLIAAILLAAIARGPLRADPPLNLRAPTTGGKQFWADELHFHKWRIQRNVLTGHCRLLDGDDVRYAWGTFDQCRAELATIRRERELPPMKGTAVVLLHGLFRSRETMAPLSGYLEEQGGYTVINVSYPTTRRDIPSHAHMLGRVIENLDGITDIHFVAHSMGNIVVRYYLAGASFHEPEGRRDAKPRLPDPRVRRLVMLAPPNNGSLAADFFSDNGLFRAVAGGSAQQLGKKWEELAAKLRAPPCPFGIIAGGYGDGKGLNPLLPGDDDGVVTVDTTQLPGARDFSLIPSRHSKIPSDDKAMEQTLRFLRHGHFISKDARKPITQADAQ